MNLSSIVRWLDAHALSIALYLGLAAAFLRAAHAMLARLLAPYPRARAFVEAVAAMAPDVLRFLGQAYALLTGRALPSTGTPPAPPLSTADLAEKSGAVVVSETRPRDGAPGYANLRALLAVVVTLAVIACIPITRAVLDHTTGVPPRGTGALGVQRCTRTDAGVYLPVVGDRDGREWPTHPRRPDGTQRTCAPGEGCEVSDAGVAHCTPSTEGVRP